MTRRYGIACSKHQVVAHIYTCTTDAHTHTHTQSLTQLLRLFLS